MTKDTQQRHILVVDDEKALTHALQMKLSHAGYEVSTAANGEEALQLLEKNTYSLILLDLVMPVMDGFEVLEQMKKKHISTPVIVATNLGQEEDMKRAQEYGVTQYFVKANTPLAEIVKLINKS